MCLNVWIIDDIRISNVLQLGIADSEAEVYGGLGLIRVIPSEFCNVPLSAGKRRDSITITDPNNN